LSEWILTAQDFPAKPAVLHYTEMVAECRDCRFTVEYRRMESS
jgi:hypothetical protein